jgi:hypothetical protein
MSVNPAALFAVSEFERLSRLREFRLVSLLMFGRDHALTRALAAAIADPGAIEDVLAEIDALPALPRRRLLATLASVLPSGSG